MTTLQGLLRKKGSILCASGVKKTTWCSSLQEEWGLKMRPLFNTQVVLLKVRLASFHSLIQNQYFLDERKGLVEIKTDDLDDDSGTLHKNHRALTG